MGLNTLMMQEVCSRLKAGDRVSSFGYPDIVASPKEIESVLGAKVYNLKYRDDSDGIGAWHGVRYKIPDAHSFFGLLGARLDVYDVVKHRGGEIIADLNYPMHTYFMATEAYDFVLDVGTIEHVINIWQAAKNMAGMLKAGGIIVHENPHSGWGNHGFYNLNPTWYADFYGQAGFELIDLFLVANGKKLDVPRTGRFRCEVEANAIAIARRTEVLPIEFVTQHKYRNMLPDAGARAA